MQGLPAGAWVAISIEKECVLAYGEDADTVEQEAMRMGDDHPLLTRVPDPNVMMFF
jgi:hypothetical protein